MAEGDSVNIVRLPDGAEFSVLEAGSGSPLVYLPGFPDIGSVSQQLLPFHQQIASHHHVSVVLPRATDPETGGVFPEWRHVDDVIFRYLWLMDELGLDQCDLIGHSLGGWFASEVACWSPRRIRRLVLISPAGLDLEDRMTPDIFMKAQPRDGFHRGELRELLFADPDGDLALTLFPDHPLAVDEEMRRFAVLRLAALVGWTPAYLYDRDLSRRLLRPRQPALVINGAADRFVGVAYGRRFAELLGAAQHIVAEAGHAPHLEQPSEVAHAITEFLG